MTVRQDKTLTILIVDDTPANVSLLEAVLSEEYTIMTASQGSEALAIALEMPPDLILLDIMMPGMDGYELCERLKKNPRLREIPVIFQSSLNSADVKAKAFKSGGVDYISKPFLVAELRACVHTHLMIKKLQLQLEDQTQTLEQTVAERDQMTMIVESSNDAIFSVSTDNIITSWNKEAENIFGYAAGEIIGTQIFTIIPSDRFDERPHILGTILRGEQLKHFETIRLRKDGNQIRVSITILPQLTAEGEIIGCSVIASDITERR